MEFLNECLTEIASDPRSHAFLSPVPWKKYGMTDFPEVIKKPMDISKVREKLLKADYEIY